ncbi:hypothetical protein SAMN02745146_0108 [Hymenobacter daecheongensis DSM 21074]|uniref:Microcystin-dependent protein n=1 Tax=Hymenobacter daecheongensis DSM 21074 TaxID=1121955 RepID=A0A1M6LYZ3_9BACT|nr:hypothetical protein [Hymenobacter daecheongensis]SHJ76414.1 hypothetical protein SAMN02745146_0108 [Hymenobacter daecheongensis DSM 21074]
MKNLIFETGGRPFVLDDLATLQEEFQYALYAPLLALPPCVVSGCEVGAAGAGVYDVGPGLVWLNGALHRFAGASAVALPGELYVGPLVVENGPYQTGGQKPVRSEALALLRAAGNVPGQKVLVTEHGVLRAEKAREAGQRMLGDTKWLTKLAAGYFLNGRGLYGTVAYGWALADGQHTTEQLGGVWPVGYKAGHADYGVLGKQIGLEKVALTVEEGPAHGHDMDQAGSHSHSVSVYQAVTGQGDNGSTRTTINTGLRDTFTTSNTGAHTHGIRSSGEGLPHENRPPSKAMVVLEWIGF